MRKFDYGKLEEKKWDSEVMGLVAEIYRERGREEMYVRQRPQELEKLVEIAKVQSTESSNAIEGIVTTSTRVRMLVEEKTKPRNRDEIEIAGYRDVLNVIHESYEAIPVEVNYILQLHGMMYKYMNNPAAGRIKSVQNYISARNERGEMETVFTPLKPVETQGALERICEEYNREIENPRVEPLVLIATFIHDFVCIHPFNDGNGRISRLLTTLMLYKSGFRVGRYISLEKKVEESKGMYYEALREAQVGWHEGKEDKGQFIKYLLGVILAAYRDLDERFEVVEEKTTAVEMVRKVVRRQVGKFNKGVVRECCPTLSVSAVEGALRKLVAEGEIERRGTGRATYYVRLK